jgi:hypothetical protein
MKTFININLDTFQPTTNELGEVTEYLTKEAAQEASKHFIGGEYFAQPLIKQRAKRTQRENNNI